MIIFPAIDIIDGKCVMLKQGKFDEKTIFYDKPYLAAKQWEDKGASYIHIVDLDGAKKGSAFSDEVIKEIIENISIPIQVGGGIRTIEDIKAKLDLGVSRVIIGTAAIENPELMKEAIKLFGNKIALAVDAKDGIVAIKAWQEYSEKKAVDLCLEMKELGIETIIYTDIDKDGMMGGANVEATKEIIDKTGLNVIASGGVCSMKDLEEIKEINAYGAIIGKALYESALNLEEVINKFER